MWPDLKKMCLFHTFYMQVNKMVEKLICSTDKDSQYLEMLLNFVASVIENFKQILLWQKYNSIAVSAMQEIKYEACGWNGNTAWARQWFMEISAHCLQPDTLVLIISNKS